MRDVSSDAFTRIYGVSFTDDAQYSQQDGRIHWPLQGLTTGYVASSLALAPLPIAELLYDKAYFNADKLYFGPSGAAGSLLPTCRRRPKTSRRETWRRASFAIASARATATL